MDGNRIIFGDLKPENGRAIILEKSGASWSTYNSYTIVGSGNPNQFGFSVDISGDYAIVGNRLNAIFSPAKGDNKQTSQSGAAYIFKRNATQWTETTKLIAPTPGQQYGCSVGISGNLAVVGLESLKQY